MHGIIVQSSRRRPWRLLTAVALTTFFAFPGFGRAVPLADSDVVIDRAATRKICQVTGETDRSTGRQTINATETRFKFWGTDLGSSFEHDGKLVFLFGDTHAVPGLHRVHDRDIIGTSTTADPEDCIKLDVMTDGDGGYRPLTIPHVDGGEFSVPTAGFSANGVMYVIATTGQTATSPMGHSVLASSSNGGHDFRYEYDLSSQHFINAAAAAVTAEDTPGLPQDMGDAVLLWGSGSYRKSDAYLAALPKGRPGDHLALRYFAGLDSAGAPVWSSREQDSAPLFKQSCIGELSVAWNPDLRKWVMLYNCGEARSQIMLRTADRPWGPWSQPQVLFDAADDKGFCHFMNGDSVQQVSASDTPCQAVSDPHDPEVAGDPYAPYLIAKFSRGVAGSHSDIYFMMSTWNPYNVVLMKARLKLHDQDPLREAGLGDSNHS